MIIAKANLRIILYFDVLISNKTIRVNLEYKRHLKNVYLRILNKNTLHIKAHKYFTLNDAKKLLIDKDKWIKKHLENFCKNELLEDEYYFLGHVHKKETLTFDEENYYKQEAKIFLPELVDEYANKMSLFPSSLTFRKNKSRWGSCSYNNSISLNTRLMKFPLDVIIYVIIHELAHIKHKNHSKDFWNEVEKYCINYKSLNQKLKEY